MGNSLDKLRHARSAAYSVELVLLNKQHISGGGAYPDCYRKVQLLCRLNRPCTGLSQKKSGQKRAAHVIRFLSADKISP